MAAYFCTLKFEADSVFMNKMKNKTVLIIKEKAFPL